MPDPKKIFSYEDASALLPVVQQMTTDALQRVESLDEGSATSEDYQTIVQHWAEAVMSLGIDVKGLWLVDFDNGSGYYCWQHPEQSLQYFHGYDEGFQGRVRLQ